MKFLTSVHNAAGRTWQKCYILWSRTIQADLLLLHAGVLRLQLDHLLVVGLQLLRQRHQLALLPQPQLLVALDAGRQLLDLGLQSLNLDLEGTEVVVLEAKGTCK